MTTIRPRILPDVADLAIAIQANLYQLKVAQSRLAGTVLEQHDIQVPPPGAVLRFREALISRDTISQYEETTMLMRMHEAWGQYCLFCWYLHVPDPQHPPDFRHPPSDQPRRCDSVVLFKTLELEKSLWRLRYEQRWRRDPAFKRDPYFEQAVEQARKIPMQVFGEEVQICPLEHLIFAGCEYAGMLAAIRWIGDDRWNWNQPGIMDLGAEIPI